MVGCEERAIPVKSSQLFKQILSLLQLDRVKWQVEYQSTYLTIRLSFGMSTVRYNIINCLNALTKKKTHDDLQTSPLSAQNTASAACSPERSPISRSRTYFLVCP